MWKYDEMIAISCTEAKFLKRKYCHHRLVGLILIWPEILAISLLVVGKWSIIQCVTWCSSHWAMPKFSTYSLRPLHAVSPPGSSKYAESRVHYALNCVFGSENAWKSLERVSDVCYNPFSMLVDQVIVLCCAGFFALSNMPGGRLSRSKCGHFPFRCLLTTNWVCARRLCAAAATATAASSIMPTRTENREKTR